ncbi:MAG: 4-phosphoerythronate dehydrogenase [Ignavibacteria bacterium]|nr:4-phosphoerythronate dehydrogenase [Ignavibacteria bacterium]
MIFIDEDIPILFEYLGKFDSVQTFSGRTLNNQMLRDYQVTALFVRSTCPVNQDLLVGTAVSFVGSATAGIDHVDQAYLAIRGIQLAYAPGSNSQAVTDYVFDSLRLLTNSQIIAREFSDTTICVIGIGNIGSRVVESAISMGYNVLISDPPKGHTEPLRLLLPRSDVVTLHVPYTTSGSCPTHKLVGQAEVNLLKPGTVLINTSRGKVIDEALVIDKCLDGSLVSVLDVFESEPHANIRTVSNADLATPHIAGYTHSAKICGSFMVLNAYLESIGESIVPHQHEIHQDRTKTIDYISTMFKKEWASTPKAETFDGLRSKALTMSI